MYDKKIQHFDKSTYATVKVILHIIERREVMMVISSSTCQRTNTASCFWHFPSDSTRNFSHGPGRLGWGSSGAGWLTI